MLKYKLTRYIAGKHIAGPDLKDALAVCNWAAAGGWYTAISVWTGESSSAEENTSRYQEIISAIIRGNLKSYVSIKPSAINFDLKLFKQLAENAAAGNIRIHFDSLSPDLADRYLSFLNGTIKIYRNVGYTIPSRWMRSTDDADKIMRLNIPVRVVKGQWPDPVNRRIDSRENYLRIIRKLAGRVPLIGIATHERSLAEKAIGIVNETYTKYELEQFFSLPSIEGKLNKKFKPEKRLYVAYGEPYLPYNLSSANKRPGMILWVLKDMLSIKPKYKLKYLRLNEECEKRYEVAGN